MRRCGLIALTAAVFTVCAAPALADGPTITIVPPPGAHVSTIDSPPHYFRTPDQQPTIGIEASGGSQLQCSLDDGTSESCGAPSPGCPAALCGSFRPPAPLIGRPASDHILDVKALDANGQVLSEVLQGFTVDDTPPTVSGPSVLGLQPLRPTFLFSVTDDQSENDDNAFSTLDVVDCSFGRVGSPVVWSSCPVPGPYDTSTTVEYRLPAKHIDYRFGVRGVDDFGRTTTAFAEYDPVPCVLVTHPPRRLRTLANSGLVVRVKCSYVGSVDIGLWPMSVNGRVYSRTPAGTVRSRPLLGAVRLRGRGQHWQRTWRLRLYRLSAAQARRFASTRFLLTACPGNSTCDDRVWSPSWSSLQFTARR